MRKIIRFEVTNDDIQKGERKNPTDCMVSRACKRQLGTDDISVDGKCLEIGQKSYILPFKIQKLIENWDEGGNPEPFSFNIDLDEPTYNNEDE